MSPEAPSPAATAESHTPTVLLVDDEVEILSGLVRSMRHEQFRTVAATSATQAQMVLSDNHVDVIVSDEDMPGMRGGELLALVRRQYPDIARIMLTGRASLQTAIDAINDAAVFHFHTKPCHPRELANTIHAALTSPAAHRDGSPANDRTEATKLNEALSQVSLASQPIVNARTHDAVGREVLVRCPTAAFATTDELIASGIRLRRGIEIDRVVRAHVADDLACRTRTTGTHEMIFVNTLPGSLGDPQLGSRYDPLLQHASRIVLEITERQPFEFAGDVSQQLDALRQHGYRFALDDFGSGHANLDALEHLQPEFIKLDASLVRNSERYTSSRMIINAMIAFARETGAHIIAEGIETAEQARSMKTLGCDLLQGFRFGRPTTPVSDRRRVTSHRLR
jgi:EAL domain-containing protein (putative c-di-GMP-specific phosphodiesterase class I)